MIGARAWRGTSLLAAGVVVLLTTSLFDTRIAIADDVRTTVGPPNGARFVRALGRHATRALAPSSAENGSVGALVEIPQGTTAESLGLDAIAPGLARLRGRPEEILAFAELHRDLRLEVGPPLRPLMDQARRYIRADVARTAFGSSGRGTMIGVVDVGLDVTHRDLRRPNGTSRVAWMLDLSMPAQGKHPELEARFGYKSDDGTPRGAVYSADMIDAAVRAIDSGTCQPTPEKLCAPVDPLGHGTFVTAIAAASAESKYPGVAPDADIVFVNASRGTFSVEEDDIVRAVDFLFDRADAAKRPIAVNLSLGTEFGPHDGSMLWEQALARHVGSAHPGHALIAAAGNSGDIDESRLHQSVFVTSGAPVSVPMFFPAGPSVGVHVWVAVHPGADLSIGADVPGGTWISPVPRGGSRTRDVGERRSSVVYGRNVGKHPFDGEAAIVSFDGPWVDGRYAITFEGSGAAELWIESTYAPASFAHGVREGTINQPATHPSIIAVGCTVNRTSWTTMQGTPASAFAPALDPNGGLPLGSQRPLADGEICAFSSAGPTMTGVAKPEIAAPGALVVAAMSAQAKGGRPNTVFPSATCNRETGGRQNEGCLQIDEGHGILRGTSMSSPMVAGVAALLFERDPTLTQDAVRALLQAGAHRFRGTAPFEEQAGPGEVDAIGALDALDQLRDPKEHLPSLRESWITLGSSYVAADGSIPITAIVELRTEDAAHRADAFDAARLAAYVAVDGTPVEFAPLLVRRGPGVWFFTWTPPPGLGGRIATFGVMFDGAAIVAPKSAPIATDVWNGRYASAASGSACATSPRKTGTAGAVLAMIAIALAAVARRVTGRRTFR